MSKTRNEPFAAPPGLHKILWRLIRLTRVVFIAGFVLIIPEIVLLWMRWRYVKKYINQYPSLSEQKWGIGYFALILLCKLLYNSWGIVYVNSFEKALRITGTGADYERVIHAVFRMLILWAIMAAAGFAYTLYSIGVYARY